MNTVNIDGIDKVDLLIALHGASQPLGLGFIQEATTGGVLDRTEVEGWLTRSKYFDYVQGRIVKCDLTGPEMDVWGYDRDNGAGAAERVVEGLRAV